MSPSWQRIIAVLVGLLVAAVLVEGGLRLFGRAFHWRQDRQNAEALDGLVDVRILCVGESTTALGGTASYPSQLEDVLVARSGRRVQVINAGVPGGDSGDILGVLPAQLERYRPHLVVAMMGANDVPGEDGETVGQGRPVTPYQLRTRRLGTLLLEEFLGRVEPGPPSPPRGMEAMPVGTSTVEDAGLSRPIVPGSCGRALPRLRALLEVEPENQELVTGLAICLEALGQVEDARRAYAGVLAQDPVGLRAYARLAERDPENTSEFVRLSARYDRLAPSAEVGALLARAIRVDPANPYLLARLATHQARLGHGDVAARLEAAAAAAYRAADDSMTRRNHRALKALLDERGVRLVAVQYPTRSLDLLARYFEPSEGVILVDNEAVFRRALEAEPFDALFSDDCYGGFGHGTARGNRLLAESVAAAILPALGGGVAGAGR